MQGDDEDVLYTVAAIAAWLGTPEKATQHRVEAGDLPTFKMGRIVCARKSTLRRWLTEQEQEAERNRRIGR